MNVKLIRMVTGEDLIAEVLVQTDQNITIKNPCVIILRPTQSGNANISITHWVPYAESNEFTLALDRTVFVVEPAQDLLNNYNSAFGSGIVVPLKSPIIAA